MVDVTTLKTRVSLLDLAERDTTLRRVAGTAGGEWHGPCPRCGGRDRFRVQPEGGPDGCGWAACRQCWPKGGDVIGYVMWRDGVDFRAACDRLGGATIIFRRTLSEAKGQARTPTRRSAPPAAAPGDAWQAAARSFVDGCAAMLWATAGPFAEGAGRARDWLHARGLTDETLRRWRIGYNPRETWAGRKAWGLPEEVNPQTGKPRKVWLPRGVVIVCEIGGRLWYVKFRRVPGESFACRDCKRNVTGPGPCPSCRHDNPKYPATLGTPALYLADTLKGHTAAVLTEGEFDALLLWQEAGNRSQSGVARSELALSEAKGQALAGVATLATAGRDLDVTAWAAYLLPLRRLLLAYDTDGAGKKGAAKLAALTRRARRLTLPALPNVKDLTDFHKAGGNLRDWLTFELARLEMTLPASCPIDGTSPVTASPANDPSATLRLRSGCSSGQAVTSGAASDVTNTVTGNVNPARLKIRWPAGLEIGVIGDHWQREADGAIVAEYTEQELAWALACVTSIGHGTAGQTVTALAGPHVTSFQPDTVTAPVTACPEQSEGASPTPEAPCCNDVTSPEPNDVTDTVTAAGYSAPGPHVTSIGDGNSDCHGMTPDRVTSMPLPGDDDPDRWAAIFAEESAATSTSLSTGLALTEAVARRATPCLLESPG